MENAAMEKEHLMLIVRVLIVGLLIVSLIGTALIPYAS
jgi:hypothetical protein